MALLKGKGLSDIPMALVTHGPVLYNAKVLAEAAQKQRHELMYRGLKVTKKVAGGV